jgi:hypothetical protein
MLRLPDGVEAIVPSFIAYFRDEFVALPNGRCCSAPREIELPKIMNYTPGVGFFFDDRQALKRPDSDARRLERSRWIRTARRDASAQGPDGSTSYTSSPFAKTRAVCVSTCGLSSPTPR